MRMPSFVELTQNVISRVEPEGESDIAKAISEWQGGKQGTVPLDQIFYLLQKRFGKEHIDDIVADELRYRSTSKAYPPRHRDILEISKSAGEKIPQVVTTNFDILFEKAHNDKNIRINFPPFLPDLSGGTPIAGITYIHGRINQHSKHVPKKMNAQNNLTLSKSDLGEAYLSKGWAARLVRYLISNYTVVFIGYRADDPPMQYMLMGMERHSTRHNLYAFEEETTNQMRKDEWKEKGVTLIPYSNHDDLWKTISEWAKMRRNLSAWRKQKLMVTAKDPKTIRSYQRGQVVYLLRTVQGVKYLRSASPSANAEWINVFDETVRKDEKLAKYITDNSGVKRQSPYLLDDDNADYYSRDKRSTINLLEDNGNRLDESTEISGEPVGRSRTAEFIDWICDNLDSPAMAWWFSRKHTLNRKLLKSMEKRLYSISRLNWKGRLTWKLIIESHAERSTNFPWKRFDIAARSSSNKWDKSILREFSNVTNPYITREDSNGEIDTYPPESTWGKVSIYKIANLNVEFPMRHMDSNIIPPRNAILEAVRIFQTNLLHATFMIFEVDKLYGPKTYTASCYQMQDDHKYIKNMKFYHEISWFIDIFNELVNVDPKSAKMIAMEWPVSDRYFFRKLKLFALSNSAIFKASDVSSEVMKLTDDEFWCNENIRELLFLLKRRWSEFDDTEKQDITGRIVDYSLKVSSNEGNMYARETAVCYGRWLQLHGCKISEEHDRALQRAIASLDDWRDERAKALTKIVVVDGDELIEYVHNADEETYMEEQAESHRNSNVQQIDISSDDAAESVSLLLEAEDIKYYTPEQWDHIFRTSIDMTDTEYRDILSHLAKLPQKTLRDMEFGLSSHLGSNFQRMVSLDSEIPWIIFDRFISSLENLGEMPREATFSHGIQDGKRGSSYSCYEQAIYGTIGKSTLGLISCIDATTSEIPFEVKSRLRNLLSGTVAGRSQCVSMLTSNIGFFNHVDPDWTRRNLLPLFDFQHEMAEFAWGGLLYYPRLLDKDTFSSLSHLIYNLYPWINSFSWKDTDLKRCSFLVITAGTVLARELNLSNEGDIRECLRNMDRVSIRYSIFWLRDIGEKANDGWRKFVVPFLNSVWPHEESFQSTDLVRTWQQLLIGSGHLFPDVYSSVKDFLVPIERHSFFLRNFVTRRYGQEPLASAFPFEVLSFIDAVVPNDPIFPISYLDEVLDIIGNADGKFLHDERYIRLLSVVN